MTAEDWLIEQQQESMIMHQDLMDLQGVGVIMIVAVFLLLFVSVDRKS